ncbi:MAG: hypothetical protein GZ085_07230 [Sulfuriferula multivorans]|uniref:Uncharacterized protein n=1 Tax=Sulfuriferula multivorans TaxID=1559896 RepID=A0A7C9K2T8_9PROT|nr:hypothetical protein [Sulfuriferula multivorans]
MNARNNLILGAAVLGLALAAPVQAAPDFIEGSFIVAKRDQPDDARQDKRETRKSDRRDSKHEAGRETPPGYGYGYERRQQEKNEQDDRSRDRR